MRLFEEYGTPSTAGDITYIDYLFLGAPKPSQTIDHSALFLVKCSARCCRSAARLAGLPLLSMLRLRMSVGSTPR